MKILHITPENDPAGPAARALHEIAQNVALTWAHTPGSALQWLQENRDAAAIVVEVQAQSCASFVGQVRGLGLTTPIVVVAASFQVQQSLDTLNAGADGYLVAGSSLQADLPRIVGQAIDRERGRRQLLAHALTELGDRHRASLARDARICSALQQRLFELESALRNADERGASEAGVFADQVAKRHAEFTASLTSTLQSRDALATRLGTATAALDEAQQARRADAAAAAEHLRRREGELGAALMEAVAARATLERALAEMEAAQRDARQRAESDLAAANERQAALEDLLTQEVDRRTNLDQQLAAAEAAHQEADHRHTTELTRVVARLADVQARSDAAQEEKAATRAAFERHSADAASALERAELVRKSDAAAAAEQLARRDAELTAQQAGAAAAMAALEKALTGAQALEQQLAAAETARQDDDQRHTAEQVAAGTRLADLQARHDAAALQHTVVRAALARKDEAVREIQQESQSLRHALGETQDQLQDLHRVVDDERRAHEGARLTSASELNRVSAEYGQLRQSFDRLQVAFQTLEQIAGEHAAERARLEGVVADRDSELRAQTERHGIAERVAQDAFAQLEETLRQSLAASGSDVARLQREIDALRRELDAARTHAEALRGDAERVPDLEMHLEVSQRERRREFERAPYGLCRCTQTGVITDANHSFVAMLGYRRAGELRNMDFATAVFDRAGDLGWLLERTRSMRRTEAVETSWQTREGRDLVVRLQASATTTGAVEIVVEDITGVRALEERLRQAQRMEAVGRLASEVAVTCDALLGDVTRGVQEWVAASGGDGALRRQGERLLTDVTRTASFLRQLGVYGDQQVRALEPVSVQRVLRDLAPVLKRVVGDEIALVLSKSSGSFEVDVEAERLERVLVNVAGYARERMPRGGQMRIDVGMTALGRRFVARYPNVRPGHHVLITVTELPGAGESRGDTERDSSSSDKPGVELGALVDLIGTSGGHLWMEVQPAGNMVVKMYLPRRAAADVTDTRAPAARPGRGGRLARWFRATPPAGVRG